MELVLIVKVRHSKNFGDETGYKPIARTITINRSSVDRVTLRILRRLTWTGADGLGSSTSCAASLKPPPIAVNTSRTALFSDHYLTTRLKDDPAWAASPNAAFAQVRAVLEAAKPKVVNQDENTARQHLFQPLFSALGFKVAQPPPAAGFVPQPPPAADSIEIQSQPWAAGPRPPAADSTKIQSQPGAAGPRPPANPVAQPPSAVDSIHKQSQPGAAGLQAAGPQQDYDLLDSSGVIRAAALVYQWDRWLDGPDDRDPLTPTENPGAMVVSLLENGNAPWVIVTNGRHWRLYSRAAHSRSTNFYEVELEEALQAGDGIDPNEAFRYFWLFFRAEAFQPTAADAKGLWLDAIVQGSRDYAREVERELKKRVFERVVPFLAKGFLADRAKRLGIKTKPDDEELETIRQGTLTLLYRILFLLYAESRDLLPVRESPYFELSLKKLEMEIADHAGSAESISDENLAAHFPKDQYAIYQRLSKLCAAMDTGDAAVNVPTYNGGLFRTRLDKAGTTDRDAAIARFLHEHQVPDLHLAMAIDHLARVPDLRQGFGLAFVDYKSLGVRQLGSIYEGLLEYKLFVAEEDLVEIKEKSKIAFKPLNLVSQFAVAQPPPAVDPVYQPPSAVGPVAQPPPAVDSVFQPPSAVSPVVQPPSAVDSIQRQSQPRAAGLPKSQPGAAVLPANSVAQPPSAADSIQKRSQPGAAELQKSQPRAAVLQKSQPGAAGLRLRNARIVHRGDVYLANDKAERKATGSYYTPENIVEYIVDHTVGPVLQRKLDALVPEFRKAEQTYHRLLSNAAADSRIMLGSGYLKAGRKPAPEQVRAWAAGQAYDAHRELVEKLFDLKVLDPAMGSGHFLVDAVDFITDKLLVWLNQFRPFNPVLVMLDRTRRNILESLNTQGVNIDPDRLTDVHLLKRHVLKRCIYGVDLNPLATELAKVSLWLDAFTLGAPLSFLDHHLRVGNSLIGANWTEIQSALGEGKNIQRPVRHQGPAAESCTRQCSSAEQVGRRHGGRSPVVREAVCRGPQPIGRVSAHCGCDRREALRMP